MENEDCVMLTILFDKLLLLKTILLVVFLL